MLIFVLALYITGGLLAAVGALRPWLATLPDERRAKHALEINQEWKERIEAAATEEERMNMESEYRNKKNEPFEGSDTTLGHWVDMYMGWVPPRAQTVRAAQRQRRLDVPFIGSGVVLTTVASGMSLLQ